MQQDSAPACSHGKVDYDGATLLTSTEVNALAKMTNKLDLSPLDYHVWGAMLERCKTFNPKLENIGQLKQVLLLMWGQLPQDPTNKAILSFTKRI